MTDTGGRVEEVRGPAARLATEGGVAAVLRYPLPRGSAGGAAAGAIST
ncbi:MAG: hypothetical protein U0531_09230 [Dehalococcoidia bacterium]